MGCCLCETSVFVAVCRYCRYFYVGMDVPCSKKSAVVVRKSTRMGRGVESLHKEINFTLPYVSPLLAFLVVTRQHYVQHKRFGSENSVLQKF